MEKVVAVKGAVPSWLMMLLEKQNEIVDWINEHYEWHRRFFERYNDTQQARGEPDPK